MAADQRQAAVGIVGLKDLLPLLLIKGNEVADLLFVGQAQCDDAARRSARKHLHAAKKPNILLELLNDQCGKQAAGAAAVTGQHQTRPLLVRGLFRGAGAGLIENGSGAEQGAGGENERQELLCHSRKSTASVGASPLSAAIAADVTSSRSSSPCFPSTGFPMR